MGNIRLISTRSKRTVSKPANKTVSRSTSNAASKATDNAASKTTSSPVRNTARKTKRRTGVGTAFTIILIIMIGILALLFSLGFYVGNLDTVFPNVWADGVDLSGMTLEEATNALISAGYENNAQNASVTVTFPDGASFTVSGDEAGLALSAAEAAEAAFNVGRNGSFLENEIAFVRSLLTRTDLRDVSIANFDDTLIRELAGEYTRSFNVTLINDAYSIEGDSIVIVVGTGIQPADEGHVIELAVETLFLAMEEQAHLTVGYVPVEMEANDVDLQLLYDTIRIDPVSAVYDPATFSATESSTGVSFDMDAAQAMVNRAARGETIIIPLILVEPEVTAEDIESMLFRDVLSERTTNIAGTQNRLTNIIVSSEFVNGTRLNPGDVFSFNQIVGRRTREAGFREAGAFVSGRLVDQVGGGICQTASTIYYCLLRADIEVVERRPHGLTVGYLPLGHDATIVWGNTDLKFRNNTDFPIEVEAIVEGRSLTVRLIGTKLDDTYITTDFEILRRTPFEIQHREDDEVPQGQTRVFTDGSTGYVVEVYKNLFDENDNLIRRWSVGRSTYNVQQRVILVPPTLPESTPPEVTTPVETPPVDTLPNDTPPTDTPPVDSPPNDTPPDDGPPDYLYQPPADTPVNEIPDQPPLAETPVIPPESGDTNAD